MQPIDIYKLMLDSLTSMLKKHNYSCLSQNIFRIIQDGNYGFISFQKSQSNTYQEIRFTINLGICSKLLLNFLEPEKKPTPNQCHSQWDYRIGHLIKEFNFDKWWSIDEQTNSALLISEIEKIILNYAIPEIKNNISDDKLLATWLSGKCTGISNVQRLINLSVLLANVNMRDEVKIIIKELEGLLDKGSSAGFIIIWHLKKLRAKYDLVF